MHRLHAVQWLYLLGEITCSIAKSLLELLTKELYQVHFILYTHRSCQEHGSGCGSCSRIAVWSGQSFLLNSSWVILACGFACGRQGRHCESRRGPLPLVQRNYCHMKVGQEASGCTKPWDNPFPLLSTYALVLERILFPEHLSPSANSSQVESQALFSVT